MSEIRLAVLDMDGTLLDQNSKLTDRTEQAMRRAWRRGIYLAVATGRPYVFVKPTLDQIGLDLPVICCNGGMVRDSRQVFYSSRFPLDKGEQVKEIAKQYGALFYVFDRERIYCREQEHIMRLFRDTGLEEQLRRDRDILHLCSTYEEALRQGGSEIVKLLVIEYNEMKYRKIKEAVLKLGLAAVTPDPHHLDICPRDVTKGAGLRLVARRLGIPLKQVMAVGDGENDLSMMELAGIGVAMKNAPKAVRERADYVTEDNRSDGAALALERFVLGGKL